MDGDYAGRVAREIDRVFVSSMALARDNGGRDLVDRYGGPEEVGWLVEFRTSLAWPDRLVTWPQFVAVTRYRGRVEIGGGGIVRSAKGFTASAHGAAFLVELYKLHSELFAGSPRLNELAGRVLDAAAATGREAFAAMAPPFEPAGMSAGGLLVNRLGTLRYHRADAHASAWRAAGLTAEEIQALPPGPARDAIEADTDRAAAVPYSVLSPEERTELLQGLEAQG